VPRTFSTTDKEAIEDENLDAQISATNTPARLKSPSPEGLQPPEEQSQTVDLYPELAKVAVNEDGEQVPLFSKLELSFVVKTVYLELFDSKAVQQRTLKEHSLIRFALNETDVKYKMVSNGSMEAEVLLRSFVSLSSWETSRITDFMVDGTRYSPGARHKVPRNHPCFEREGLSAYGQLCPVWRCRS
jgi:vacuolar protein sorting-associated protein 13A/C